MEEVENYLIKTLYENIPSKIELRSSTKLVVGDAFLTLGGVPVLEEDLWAPSGPRLTWDSGSVAGSYIRDQTEKITIKYFKYVIDILYSSDSYNPFT
jgi:hypothetical protein